jgi:hypothetical protein
MNEEIINDTDHVNNTAALLNYEKSDSAHEKL